MAIPMSALRRALAEVARDPRVERTLAAPMPGAIAGGGFGGAIGALNGHTEDGELGQDILTGAGIGAGLGVAGAGSMIRTSLREALAASAAERGIGRAAAREASHVDDAARFAEASRGPMGAAQSAEDIARQIREMSQGQPEGTVEAMVRQVGQQDPQLGRQVMEILMGQSPY